jgi:hypothetical protein
MHIPTQLIYCGHVISLAFASLPAGRKRLSMRNMSEPRADSSITVSHLTDPRGDTNGANRYPNSDQ